MKQTKMNDGVNNEAIDGERIWMKRRELNGFYKKVMKPYEKMKNVVYY